MKITDTLITTLFKHGALVEMKNFETKIPLQVDENGETKIITISAETIQFKLDVGKEEK